MKNYEELLRKYNALHQDYVEALTTIKQILDLGGVAFKDNQFVYFRKYGKNVHYLEFPELTKEYCQICLEKKSTTAHHIIPKRIKSKNTILKEIRIRICKDCEKFIHPENPFLPEEIEQNLKEKNNKIYKKYHDKCCELNALKQDLRKVSDNNKNFLYLVESLQTEQPKTQEEISKNEENNNKSIVREIS